MALMRFRESNHVKWRGVRPAHDGTQVLGYAVIAGATAVVYAVPAGQTGFVTFFSLSSISGAVGGVGALQILDDLGAFAGNLVTFDMAANTQEHDSQGFCFPLELPSGWRITVYSAVAAITSRGIIIGWVE